MDSELPQPSDNQSNEQKDPGASPPVLSPPVRSISGFWRRLVALFLDSMLLGLVGMVPGIFLFDWLASLGGLGRLIGFAVALVYFGVLNSALGRGQTIGKRIMKIEVVDKAGHHIGIGRSFARYAVLGTPYFLNGAPLPMDLLSSWLGYGVAIVVFGSLGVTIYLYLFNRRTRQSLHDLVVGTFVVRADRAGELPKISIWLPHIVVSAVLGLLPLVLAAFVPAIMKMSVFPDLIALQQKLQATGKVHSVSVYVGKNWSSINGSSHETSSLQATAVWKQRPADYQAAAGEIAAVILADYPDVKRKDVVVVTVAYGYDIGIANAWIRESVQHTPQEWTGILAGKR
jgi:uncharacterized RDD family membrane protein YckC